MNKYIITGNPIPLQRPRFSPISKRVYDSQKDIRHLHACELRLQYGTTLPIHHPLHVDLTFYMPIPQSKRKKIPPAHITRPDLDNLIKWILDIATGIIYDDDALICSISAKKIYDTNPRTEIIIAKYESIT